MARHKRKPWIGERFTMIPALTMATARVRSLGAADLRVLLFAMTFWRPKRQTFPFPQALVASELGMKRRSVREALGRLCELGLLQRTAEHVPPGLSRSGSISRRGRAAEYAIPSRFAPRRYAQGDPKRCGYVQMATRELLALLRVLSDSELLVVVSAVFGLNRDTRGAVQGQSVITTDAIGDSLTADQDCPSIGVTDDIARRRRSKWRRAAQRATTRLAERGYLRLVKTGAGRRSNAWTPIGAIANGRPDNRPPRDRTTKRSEDTATHGSTGWIPNVAQTGFSDGESRGRPSGADRATA
jgi:hypothetical protein